MIYYVHSDFHDGSHKQGDQISAADFAALKDSPDLHHVSELNDEAAARIGMRDVTPTKGVGASPDPEHATTGGTLAGGIHDGPPPLYLGGHEAKPAMANPSTAERLLDVNLDAEHNRLDAGAASNPNAIDFGR